MPNPYWDNLLDPEDSELLYSLADEEIWNNGIAVEYIARTVVRRDPIMNEPLSSQFKEAVSLDAIVENTEKFFPGNQQFVNSFGLGFSSMNYASVRISRRRFIALTGLPEPNGGDLVFIKPSRMLFEIVNVNAGDALLSGGRIFDFEIWIKPFSYGEGNSDFSEITKFNTSQPLESILDQFLEKVDQETWSDLWADSSSDKFTADMTEITADQMVQAFTGIIRADTGLLTADNIGITADDMLFDFKKRDDSVLAVMDNKIPDFAQNNAFECEGENKVTETGPFGFS